MNTDHSVSFFIDELFYNIKGIRRIIFDSLQNTRPGSVRNMVDKGPHIMIQVTIEFF